MKKRKAVIDTDHCVACGTCLKFCPKDAITIHKGIYAVVDKDSCVGCGLCSRNCPADTITILKET